jgi:exodeoxyribonuclease VII small subunit
MSREELTYQEALEELRAIHGRLRGDDVDVDTLVEDVRRAADLVAFCKERLTSVGERLEEVLSDFDQETAP